MQDYIDIEVGVAPSGVFVPTDGARAFEIANPFTPQWNSAFVSLTRDAAYDQNSIQVVQQAQLDSYAEELVRIGCSLLQDPPDIVLVPCRGALKPWRQLEAMSMGKLPAVKFFATGLGSGQNVAKVRTAIESALRPIASSKSGAVLKIAVIDTANGGNGSHALARLLRDIHQQWCPGPWQTSMHLLAPRGSQVASSAFNASDLVLGTFVCRSIVYVVDNLLVEDWEPGYGLAINHRGAIKGSVKVKVTTGKKLLGLMDGQNLIVFKSSAPWDDINAAIAKSVSEAIITDPKLEQIDDLTK